MDNHGRLASERERIDAPPTLRAKQISEDVRLELTAFDMDGMSAVTRVGDRQRLYSLVMLRSTAEVSMKLSPKTTLYDGVWERTSRLIRRSYGGFFDNFSSHKSRRYHFNPALRLSAGFRYGF